MSLTAREIRRKMLSGGEASMKSDDVSRCGQDNSPNILVSTPHKPILIGSGYAKFIRSMAFAVAGQYNS